MKNKIKYAMAALFIMAMACDPKPKGTASTGIDTIAIDDSTTLVTKDSTRTEDQQNNTVSVSE